MPPRELTPAAAPAPTAEAQPPQASAAPKTPSFVDRAPRQLAGIPAVLRRWRYVPFFELDVIIADLTPAGLKIETHYDVRARLDERFWLIVPPLDDQPGSPASAQPPVVLQAACRWYAQKEMVLGAVVTRIDRPGAERLVAMIQLLRSSGRGMV
jgi:hypothetical protein